MNHKEVLEANIRYHDKFAEKYDEKIMKGNFKRVEAVFAQVRGKRFLDMGCGTGKQLEIAMKYFENVKGIDCSPKMVELAKKITPHVILGDITDTKLPAGYYDFINCFSVLHHCYEQEPVAKEAVRLLSDGGIFYSDNDPNRNFYKLFKWWLWIRWKFIKSKEVANEDEKLAEYHHGNGLDPIEMANIFSKVGFKKVLVKYNYPENPDLFTRILIFLNRFFKSNSLCYYFSIIAQK